MNPRDKFIEETATAFISELSAVEKHGLLRETDPWEHHFGIGLRIRNKYIHGKHNDVIDDEIQIDDLSGDIVDKVLELLAKEEKMNC